MCLPLVLAQKALRRGHETQKEEFAIIYRSKNTIRATEVEPIPEGWAEHHFSIVKGVLCVLVVLVLVSWVA
jgi:hypothetical protein